MKILLTAPPAVGKSTVIARVIESYPEVSIGIVAREIVDADQQRIGFTSINGKGESAQFMRKETDFSKATIGGEYSVDIDAVDSFVVRELKAGLAAADDVLLYVDEIGRAQAQSVLFLDTLRLVLNSQKNVLASIVYDDEPWSMEFKKRNDICLLKVNVENRSDLPAILLSAYRANVEFKRLNSAQQVQVYRYLKQFIETKKFDSAKKLFDNALPYLLNDKIEVIRSDRPGTKMFAVHGQTDSHKLSYVEADKQFQCDCPLSNGRGPFEDEAATCSHEMSVVLKNLS